MRDISNAEIELVVMEEFSRRGLKSPKLSLRPYGKGGLVTYVEGVGKEEWCWVRVYEWPSDLSLNFDLRYACSIESRGSDIFSAIVSLSILKAFGNVIIDDAQYVSEGGEMTLSEFSNALEGKLAETKSPE
ncbi:hypothetical protein [Roseateles sp.]|uniref:hypothetical protein n=1 Tax=Roseateles sp. TaxID=1971397 RepID=UPI0031E2E711